MFKFFFAVVFFGIVWLACCEIDQSVRFIYHNTSYYEGARWMDPVSKEMVMGVKQDQLATLSNEFGSYAIYTIISLFLTALVICTLYPSAEE